MERNNSGGAGFEPSADELIEVLKNLENLAASNPPLYKAIVEQIKSECGKLRRWAVVTETSSRSICNAYRVRRLVFMVHGLGLGWVGLTLIWMFHHFAPCCIPNSTQLSSAPAELGSFWVLTKIEANPTQVHDHQTHPVVWQKKRITFLIWVLWV